MNEDTETIFFRVEDEDTSDNEQTQPKKSLKRRQKIPPSHRQKHRAQKYRTAWEKLDEYKDWLKPGPDHYKAKCIACDCVLTADTSVLKLHSSRQKHINAISRMQFPRIKATAFTIPVMRQTEKELYATKLASKLKEISERQKQRKLLHGDNHRKTNAVRITKSSASIKYQTPLLEFLRPKFFKNTQEQQISNIDLISENPGTQKEPSRFKAPANSPPPSPEKSMHSHCKTSEILEKYIEFKEREHHAVDSFFATMAATVKKLPPRVQAQTKREIFKIVNDAEIEYYSNDSTDDKSSLDIKKNYNAMPTIALSTSEEV